MIRNYASAKTFKNCRRLVHYNSRKLPNDRMYRVSETAVNFLMRVY